MCYSSRQRKNDHKGDSEIIRLPPQFLRVWRVALDSTSQKAATRSLGGEFPPPPELWECNPYLAKLQRQDHHPSESRKQSIVPKRISLKPQDLMLFVLPSFGITWDLTPFSSFQCLPFGMGVSLLYLSHYCILEACNLSGFS